MPSRASSEKPKLNGRAVRNVVALDHDIEPMLAEPVDNLPTGRGWRYEPKWDGFRCLVYRDAGGIDLRSKNNKPLGRYFPELVEAFAALPAKRFIIDGEILGDSFEQLQLRLHPAASRIRSLSSSQPARFTAFDMLVSADGTDIRKARQVDRRAALKDIVPPSRAKKRIALSKSTDKLDTALQWLELESGIDGIVAKKADLPYLPGERGWLKYKVWKTVDCVVAGLYWQDDRQGIVDSLLLGLYDAQGALHCVGHTRIYKDAAGIGELLRPLITDKSFTGKMPPKVNRWSGKKRNPIALRPLIVVEVQADHIRGQQFAHGSRIVRLREDKDPEDCTLDQITR